MNMLFALTVITSIAAWLALGRAPKRWARPRRGGPKITDPRAQGAAISRLWQLHSDGCHCCTAQQHAGRRMTIDEALPLAKRDAHGVHCRCHYRPLRDQRQKDRRRSDERRAGRRNDLSQADRRLRRDRRRPQATFEFALEAAAH